MADEGGGGAEEDDEGAVAVRACQWLSEDTREQLLEWLDSHSDARLGRVAREGDAAGADRGVLSASGESLLVVPDKHLLLRPTGLGGSVSGLAIEFDPGSTTIVRLFSCLASVPRACLFVGDTILAVDETVVHSATELLEALDERPSGVPITLRLRQPALKAALGLRRTENVRFAAWVRVKQLESAASAAAGGGGQRGGAGEEAMDRGGAADPNAPMPIDLRSAERRAAERLDSVLSLDEQLAAEAEAEHAAESAEVEARRRVRAQAHAALAHDAHTGASRRQRPSLLQQQSQGGLPTPLSEARQSRRTVNGSIGGGGGGGLFGRGDPEGGSGMAVLVVCGQRVRLVRLRASGTRRGVIRPTLVGVLEKQGEPGRLCLHKWRTRRFELRDGSLAYYDLADLSKPKGVVRTTAAAAAATSTFPFPADPSEGSALCRPCLPHRVPSLSSSPARASADLACISHRRDHQRRAQGERDRVQRLCRLHRGT